MRLARRGLRQRTFEGAREARVAPWTRPEIGRKIRFLLDGIDHFTRRRDQEEVVELLVLGHGTQQRVPPLVGDGISAPVILPEVLSAARSGRNTALHIVLVQRIVLGDAAFVGPLDEVIGLAQRLAFGHDLHVSCKAVADAFEDERPVPCDVLGEFGVDTDQRCVRLDLGIDADGRRRDKGAGDEH